MFSLSNRLRPPVSTSFALFVFVAGCTSSSAVDVLPSAAHCHYEARPAGATTNMTGDLWIGTDDVAIDLPLGETLGGFSDRGLGAGRLDGRTTISQNFTPSIGVHVAPRVKTLILSTDAGGAGAVAWVKVDLGASYQGLVFAVEEKLGQAFLGRVIISASHTHSGFGGFVGHSALQVGFGRFHAAILQRLAEQIASCIRRAMTGLRAARFSYGAIDNFDIGGDITVDRRHVNDALPGGTDDRRLYVLRFEDLEGSPIAIVPIFGMHGTVLGSANSLASSDAPGAVERSLEERLPPNTLVMHVQGAAADVSPGGLDDASRICTDTQICGDYSRMESLGRRAASAILAVETSAPMRAVALQASSRTFARGPDYRNFVVRNGALRYAAWDGVSSPDNVIYESNGTLRSPIDEFNAPVGAAQCGDQGFPVPIEQRLPGIANRASTYGTCGQIDRIAWLFRQQFQIDIEGPAVCETTYSMTAALRIGDFRIAFLPGEPGVILSDTMGRNGSFAVVGYSQDHQGYLLSAEDWLLGGYEASVTFWGPLDGEQVAEQALIAVRDLGLAQEPRRHVLPPSDGNVLTPDPRPQNGPHVVAGMSDIPPFLASRSLPAQPALTGASVQRGDVARVIWVGLDPIEDHPRVQVERENAAGTFEPLRRASGRLVGDGEVIIVWTPHPYASAGPKTHYYVAEWQAVPALESPLGVENQLNLTLARYRLHVIGNGYDLAGDPFEVVPATLLVSFENNELTVAFQNARGFRLLDAQVGAVSANPLRNQTVSVRIDGRAAEPTTLDAQGRLLWSTWANARTIEVVDAMQNHGIWRAE